MKKLSLLISSYILLILCACHTQHYPRVIRIATLPHEIDWRLRINASVKERFASPTQFVSQLRSLELRHGDIILWERPLRVGSTQDVATGYWLSSFCRSNKVALYVSPTKTSQEANAALVYHWWAPFDGPLDISRTSFYVEGEYLGRGEVGYEAMVQQIRELAPRCLYVLGSRLNRKSSYDIMDSPFTNQEKALDEALALKGSVRLLPSELP